jgi:hypothetical protein
MCITLKDASLLVVGHSWCYSNQKQSGKKLRQFESTICTEWLFDQALDDDRPVVRRCKPPIVEPNPFFAYKVCHSVNIQLRCYCTKQNFLLPCLSNITLHLTKLCIRKYVYQYSLFLACFFHDHMLVSQLIYNIKLIQSRFTYCAACALHTG